jgi:hypothetical protein
MLFEREFSDEERYQEKDEDLRVEKKRGLPFPLVGFAKIILSGATPMDKICSISALLAQSNPVPSIASVRTIAISGFDLIAA